MKSDHFPHKRLNLEAIVHDPHYVSPYRNPEQLYWRKEVYYRHPSNGRDKNAHNIQRENRIRLGKKLVVPEPINTSECETMRMPRYVNNITYPNEAMYSPMIYPTDSARSPYQFTPNGHFPGMNNRLVYRFIHPPVVPYPNVRCLYNYK